MLVKMPAEKDKVVSEGQQEDEKPPEKLRLTVGQILNHPWFKDRDVDDGNTRIFTEKEKAKIKVGFVYNDSSAH
jgi:hypothetical protein